jgi:hypothetical protein
MKTIALVTLLLFVFVITPIAIGDIEFTTNLQELMEYETYLSFARSLAEFWIEIVIDGFQAVSEALLRLTFVNWLTILVSAFPPFFFGIVQIEK